MQIYSLNDCAKLQVPWVVLLYNFEALGMTLNLDKCHVLNNLNYSRSPILNTHHTGTYNISRV